MPAAAARERSRPIPSSTACNWSAAAEEAGNGGRQPARPPLVTIQTGPEGQTVRQVLVEEGCSIARELYLGMVVDRAAARPGADRLQPKAAWTSSTWPPTRPSGSSREPFDPDAGLQPLPGPQAGRAARACRRPRVPLGREVHAGPVPGVRQLAIAAWWRSIRWSSPTTGDLIALDAKMTFDDNALFRHPDLAELRDLAEEEPAEVRAGKAGLSYVKLDGNIGCLVNGAGLAMSTMDLIKLHGGEPANFLDVGGGANVAAGDRGLPHPAGRQERQGGAGQHLRRHHALHDDRHGHSGGLPARSASTSRWSCGWKGPRSSKGARCWPRASWTSSRADGLTDAAKKVVAAAGEA